MTEGRVLVLNAGSATLKATVLDLPSTEPRFDRTVDWSEKTTQDTLRGAVDAILEALLAEDVAPASVNAVGHRVVHGGERFAEPTRIDDDALAALEGLSDLAPLHNPRAVATIRAAREMLAETPHVAVFDTAFHATLPEAGRRYPVPDQWVTDHGVRRYGFHGLSVAWSVRSAGVMLGRPPRALRLVVAHLGGGCSVTAIADGRSVDTSMGLTPLEGLMMGTRAGSIDPGIVFRLLRAGLAPDDIERTLEGESGLLGVGGTDEMRRLLALESEGDDRAALAIELFVRRAAAGIAAAMTTLDGLDALVFTGGIGEHAATIRSRICERLRPIGIPAPAPDEPIEGVDARTQSGPAVLVVHAREDVVIADAALAVVRR